MSKLVYEKKHRRTLGKVLRLPKNSTSDLIQLDQGYKVLYIPKYFEVLDYIIKLLSHACEGTLKVQVS